MAKAAKQQNAIVITTRGEADALLQDIAQAARRIAVTEKVASETVDRVRRLLLLDTAGARQTIADSEAAIKAWAEANKTELFTEPRSLDLNWGRLGFRWTPWKIKFLNKLKVETIVEKLRANKMRHLIRVEESVDKEKALNYDNETLAPLGMKKPTRTSSGMS